MEAVTTYKPTDALIRRLRAETYSVLDELAQIITSSADLKEVYERFIDQVKTLIPPDKLEVEVIDPAVTGELIRELAELRRKHRESLITPRQVEILRLIAIGNSYDEIATVLFVSRITAQREMRNILDRLGVNNKAHAVSEAYRQRII